MTALDADTLRNLRNQWEAAVDTDVFDANHRWTYSGPGDGMRGPDEVLDEDGTLVATCYGLDYALVIVALVNAAPALLDAAEAVERIRTLADEYAGARWNATREQHEDRPIPVKRVLTALAPPPDNRTQP